MGTKSGAKKSLKVSEGNKKRVEIKEPQLVEYYSYLSSPTRVLLINFLVGVARGFGFVMGATVLVAVLVYVMSQILVRNFLLLVVILYLYVMLQLVIIMKFQILTMQVRRN